MKRPIFTLIILLMCATLAWLYISNGAQVSGAAKSAPVLPLDDAYIHFQYARAIADGNPFHYNPDQPATSGATSLIYPLLLAVGYKLGFQGMGLGWWALLIGVSSWIGAVWLLFCLINTREKSTTWISLGMAIAFAFTGSITWAAVSGMETSLMLFAILLTLWYALREDRRGVVIAGLLVTLIRPEGLAIGLFAVIYVAIKKGISLTAVFSVLLILAGGGLQPLLNLIATGSATASGLQAKSFLYNIPPDFGVMLNNILTNFWRSWRELITGYSTDDGWYTAPILFLFALVGIFVVQPPNPLPLPPVKRGRGDLLGQISQKTGVIGLVILWLLILTAVISTLETAFWQFKRYQQPMIALIYVLAGWGLIAIWNRRGKIRYIAPVALAGLMGFSAYTTRVFLGYYRDNVREVATSQMQMANYVATSIPTGAIVGVHDIGVMRYLGGHPTYDVIGLTTPNAARAWRNGPGSVYEQMRNNPLRPDYFAIYPDARGLTYFQNTGLFRTTLAAFPSTSPPRNIASATSSGQNVYKADWTYAAFADQPWQPSSLAAVQGMKLVDQVNVADLTSEDAHHYRWWEAAKRPGFPTELYELNYIDCHPSPENPTCKVLDGGRLITGGESMTINTEPGKDLIWITRVHPRNVATLNVFIGDQQIGTRVIPAIPGQWLEIATLIPGKLITSTQTQLRIDANITDPAQGHYMPYYHWFYQGDYQPDTSISNPESPATFGGTIRLLGRHLAYNPDQGSVQIDLEWQTDQTNPAKVDAKTFIHLYDSDNKLVAQLDSRSGHGTLPPANWLPGTVRDSYILQIPANTVSGTYRVAIGLYDPVTNQRLGVDGEGVGSDNRLFIGSIEIK